VTIARPVAAATKTMAEGTAPTGAANPRVNSEDPAAVNADVTPPLTNGHSSSEYPTKEIPSHAVSCPSSIAAACPASTRSRRR
jgi:hypothetical protein